MKKRVLVIAPHPDDESFGCLGTLLLHEKQGAEFAFQWFTNGRGFEQFHGAARVAVFFQATVWGNTFQDQELDQVPLKSLITDIENTVHEYKPTIVYIPFIGDLNKDHRLVSEAAMVALRPYKFKKPPEIWMYRIPGTTELGLRPFYTDKVVGIDRYKKEKLLKDWYPDELINGRSEIISYEAFEKWPR